MKLVFILPIFFAAFPALLFAQENNAAISVDHTKKSNITHNLKVYAAGTKGVGASLAFLYYTGNKFHPVQKTNNEFINDGLISSEKWFAVTMENTTNEEISTVFEFILSGVNTIDCYMVNDVQKIIFVPSSQSGNKESQQGLLSKSETFNIRVSSQEKVLLLIHTINKGQLLYVPAYVYSLGYFRETDIYRNNFFGIFQGIFVFIIIFNLLIYISTWDKIYLFYMLYAFTIAMFAMNDVGAAPFGFFPINLFSGQTFLFCGFCAWLLLMERFIMLTRKNFIFYRLLRLLAITDLLYAFLPSVLKLFLTGQNLTVQNFYQAGLHILFAINLLFIIITNISRISNQNRLAIFYAAANIPVLLGTLIYYSNYYKIANIQLGWLNPIALGLSLETFVLSFGFAYRFNLIGKEKTRLLVQINKQHQELTEQIITAQEIERKRIAEDIHDELGSNLAALKINLQANHEGTPLPEKKYNQMIYMIEKASKDLRRIAHNLMPPEFTQNTLPDLLSAHIYSLNTENANSFQFIYSGESNHFSKQAELFIYRIIMELSNNIIRHAAATEATIQLLYYNDHLKIMAEDNGSGFSKHSENMSLSEGMGLKNIQSRILYLQGTLNIDSSNFGTTISIIIPYPEKDENNHS